MITDRVEVDTRLVGALELIEHAGPGSGSADGHVILVPGVAAVGNAVTHLVAVDTFSISALESRSRGTNLVTAVIIAQLRLLVAAISTIIHLIAEIIETHTEMIVTLMLVK